MGGGVTLEKPKREQKLDVTQLHEQGEYATIRQSENRDCKAKLPKKKLSVRKSGTRSLKARRKNMHTLDRKLRVPRDPCVAQRA